MTVNVLTRQKDESLKDYMVRVCLNKDTYNLTWIDVKDVLNKETGESWGESKYRKWWYAFNEGMEYSSVQSSGDDLLDKLTIKKLEVQKERNKLSAEKSEINRWIREQARTEVFHEKYLDAIYKRELPKVPNFIIPKEQRDFDWNLDIADIHYGKDVKIFGLEDEILAEYNTKVFESRMWSLLNKVVHKIEKENIKHINLFNLADSVDGILRMSQLQSIQLGVIDQQIGFADFMVQWINELSKYTYVDYYGCLGNHDEIRPLGSSKGDFPGESSAKIIDWHLASMLKDNKNATIHKSKSLQYVDVVGTKILATHGQDERNLENSIKDYMNIYNKKVHMLLTGHLHNTHTKTVGMDGLQNIEFYQHPSISGIDEYSMKLKKTAPAGAVMMKIERGLGRTETFDFKLN